VRLSALKLKFFFNHGEKLIRFYPQFYLKSLILELFSAPKLKIFLIHGEKVSEILPTILPQIPYFGAF
jgi:hypothetical protein